jgi:hypothetical protein
MRLPPNRASVEEKLKDLERAGEWAQVPAASDAANAGLKPSESPQVASEEGREGEDATVELGTPLKALKTKREKKDVSHLLKLPADINARLENLLDHIPRSSKQRLIMLAIEEYLVRVERVIEKSANRKAG